MYRLRFTLLDGSLAYLRYAEPQHVRACGYGFSRDAADSWVFQSERAASRKRDVVVRHMGVSLDRCAVEAF